MNKALAVFCVLLAIASLVTPMVLVFPLDINQQMDFTDLVLLFSGMIFSGLCLIAAWSIRDEEKFFDQEKKKK